MFGHKSFLKIGVLNDASIQGLYKESYELESCSYGFHQATDKDGKVQTEVHGGSISVTIPGIPSTDLIRWSLDSRKYQDGVIVICDDNDMPLEKINFQEATCVGLDLNYTRLGKDYISSKLVIQAQRLSSCADPTDNRWVGIND